MRPNRLTCWNISTSQNKANAFHNFFSLFLLFSILSFWVRKSVWTGEPVYKFCGNNKP